MVEVPSPFVFWAQSSVDISLKVDLKDASRPNVSIESDQLNFSANGRGARGKHDYMFNLKFYGRLKIKESNYKVLDSYILFNLKKENEGFWPRLITAPSKPAWLKIDFDRWISDDMSQEDDDEVVGDVRDDFPTLYDELQKEELGHKRDDLKKVYLVIYNLCQFVGFLYIQIVMWLCYASDGPDSMTATYENVGTAMKLCTLFQWLEVMHPLFGYTRNSVLHAFVQVAGRSMVLFMMIEAEPRMQAKPVVFYLFVAWSLIEVVRYPYYVTQLNNFQIGFLTWLRYTLWIPLYPLGILCEGIIILRNIPYFEETRRFSIAMPNAWNFTFDLPTTLRLELLFLFIPGGYMMINHMYRDRVKRLGPKSALTKTF